MKTEGALAAVLAWGLIVASAVAQLEERRNRRQRQRRLAQVMADIDDLEWWAVQSMTDAFLQEGVGRPPSSQFQ